MSQEQNSLRRLKRFQKKNVHQTPETNGKEKKFTLLGDILRCKTHAKGKSEKEKAKLSKWKEQLVCDENSQCEYTMSAKISCKVVDDI